MTKWEKLLKDVGVNCYLPEGTAINTPLLRSPIGYLGIDNTPVRVELNNVDVHGIIVGSNADKVTNLCRVLCEGMKISYGDQCYCRIYDMPGEHQLPSTRLTSNGKHTYEEHVNTDNEALALMYRFENLVNYRYKILSLMNCKTSVIWNDKLNGLIGKLMTDEEMYCLSLCGSTQWDDTYYMKNSIYILDGFLDFMRLLPTGVASTVDRLLNTILKLGRSVGIHLIVTGSNLSWLKPSYKDMFSLRMVLKCSERASTSLLDGFRIPELSEDDAMMLTSEMTRPILVKDIPEVSYDKFDNDYNIL